MKQGREEEAAEIQLIASNAKSVSSRAIISKL